MLSQMASAALQVFSECRTSPPSVLRWWLADAGAVKNRVVRGLQSLLLCRRVFCRAEQFEELFFFLFLFVVHCLWCDNVVSVWCKCSNFSVKVLQWRHVNVRFSPTQRHRHAYQRAMPSLGCGCCLTTCQSLSNSLRIFSAVSRNSSSVNLSLGLEKIMSFSLCMGMRCMCACGTSSPSTASPTFLQGMLSSVLLPLSSRTHGTRRVRRRPCRRCSPLHGVDYECVSLCDGVDVEECVELFVFRALELGISPAAIFEKMSIALFFKGLFSRLSDYADVVDAQVYCSAGSGSPPRRPLCG